MNARHTFHTPRALGVGILLLIYHSPLFLPLFSSQLLLPLFNKYGVDAYFCGHDHSMQHIVYEDVQHIVSGNGAKEGYIQNFVRLEDDQSLQSEKEGRETKLAVIKPGFTKQLVTKSKMTTTFVDENGDEYYGFGQTPRC